MTWLLFWPLCLKFCRHAFGPSSGTVCLSGLLICVVRFVRAVVDSARQEDVPGMVNLVLRCCVKALLSAVDFLNKFTINFVAITGEAYCTSARMTYELLKRNLLSAVFVETVSTRLLAGITFVLSAIYAIVVSSYSNLLLLLYSRVPSWWWFTMSRFCMYVHTSNLLCACMLKLSFVLVLKEKADLLYQDDLI